jgi:hypothetical protein
MTANELPRCLACEQDAVRRVRLKGLDGVYRTCLECDAMWDSDAGAGSESHRFTNLEVFCRGYELS